MIWRLHRDAPGIGGPGVPALAAAVLLGSLAACGTGDAGDEADAVRRDSAGVEIVENPGTDRILDWTFERVATLGGEMEGAESFTSVSPATVDVDSAGRLHVLDADARRVVIFGPNLEVERILGSEGEGPGELSSPFGLDVTAGGEVAVFDGGRGGLVRWDRSGALLDLERPATPFVDRFERTPRGLLQAFSDRAPDERVSNVRQLGFVSADDTTILATRPIATTGLIRLESCGLGFQGIGRILEPRLVWTYRQAEGHVAVSAGAPYVIDVFGGSEKSLSIRRALEPRPVTEEMARRQLGEGMKVRVGGGPPRTCEAEEVLEKRGIAPELQAVGALRFAPDGSLWAVRGNLKDQEPPIDVFDPSGAYLGTLPPGTPEPLLFLPDGRLVAGEADELDVERLVVYRVDRGAGG